MRKVLLVVAVFVLSLPLVFVLWLLAAVRSPKMDSFTMKMPDSVRSMVADAALQNVPAGKARLAGLQRVIALDPTNGGAWTSVCGWEAYHDSKTGMKDCRTALSYDQTAMSWDDLGEMQEKAGDECGAEDSYTKASGLGSSGLYYGYVEHLGRASLRCGKAYDAQAGLAAAIDLEDKAMKDSDADDEDIAGDKADQLTDREYLIVTMDQMHNAAGAKEACSAAHPDWKSCACKLDNKGDVSCVAGK